MSVSIKNSREAFKATVMRVRVFSAWPEKIIDKLIEDADLRRYKDGEHVLRAGDMANVMAIVAGGTFVSQRLKPDGEYMIFDYLLQGQATGFVAVLDGLPASFDIVARGESDMVLIQRKSLLAAIALDPGRCWPDLVAMLGRRMRLEYEGTFMRTALSVRCQLAKLVLYWARGQVTGANGELRIPVAISQEDIAAMLGKSTVTISKEITALIKDGLLARAYKQIQITNPAGLERIVEREDPGSLQRSAALLNQSGAIFTGAD